MAIPSTTAASMLQKGMLAGARVLVTGGLGLIGSHLARRLVELRAEVLVLDNLAPGCGGNIRNIVDCEGQVEIVVASTNDALAVREAIAGRDYIFSLAGLSSHMDSMELPLEDLRTNCAGPLTLLEECRQTGSKAKIIFASTRQIYGRPRYLPVDEAHPIDPVDINGIHRVAAEHYHMLYRRIYGLDTSILRLTNTYGPGMRVKDSRQMFLGIWLRNLIEGRPLEVWGGQQRRDFLHARDAAEAFVAAAAMPGLTEQIFNIGGAAETSLKALADMIILENGGLGTYALRDFPKTRERIDIGDCVTDDRAFRRATNWAPLIGLQDGLRETISYYRQNLEHYV